MSPLQQSLFDAPPSLPEGFRYQPEILGEAEAEALVSRFAGLDFRPYEHRGYLGRRRVVSFGWRYDADARALGHAGDIPGFLEPARAQAAAFAGLPAETLEHALINEYSPGAPIGWHRDRPQFGTVVGLSLGAPGLLRFRRERPGGGWERAALIVEPRSAYGLSGPARDAWQHSLPEAPALRYSITFRTLRAAGAGARDRPASDPRHTQPEFD